MKKFLTFVVVAILAATVYFCFFDKDDVKNENDDATFAQLEQDSGLYPVYNSLDSDKKRAYAQICAAISNHSKSTSIIYECDSFDDAKAFGKEVSSIYRDIVFEQSEMFWADPYKNELVVKEIDGKFKVYIEPSYILEKSEAERKKERFEQKVDEIVSVANTKVGDFEKILYVYDYIMQNCYYDEQIIKDDDFNTPLITAYGCLVDGKTVCSGYTLAFETVMRRLGYECGVEFNNYSDFSILTGHVWNYCKIEDDYYYFDLTWDDTGYDDASYKEFFDYSHEFFAVTKDELSKSNFTLSADAPTPYCGGTKYNYFVYNGYNMPQYSFDAAKEIISKQSGQNYIAFRFDSYAELLKAESDLITDQKIYSLIDKTSIRYVISNSSLYLYIFL